VATREEATIVALGAQATSNERVIRQYIHENGIQSCQLVMGFTELAEGSVWNTFPPHTHNRRTEVYHYFDMDDRVLAHFMGEPAATRHLFLKDEQTPCSRPRGPSTPAAARATTSSSGAWPAKTKPSPTWTPSSPPISAERRIPQSPTNIAPMSKFENKVAVVTGASRGIGQAILLAFASEGAHAVSVDIGDNSETAEKVAALGGKFTGITADFGKLTQANARDIVSEIVAETGRVDVLSTTPASSSAPGRGFPEEDWNAVIQINLTAPFFLCQAFAKWWLSGGREKSPEDARLKIVNIASMLSFQGGILVPVLHRRQERHRRHHPCPRLRVGQGAHQRQRRRPRLHRHRKHPPHPRGREPQPGDPRPHPRRPLGHARGHRRKLRVPRLQGRRLPQRHHHECGRRLAQPLSSGNARTAIVLDSIANGHQLPPVGFNDGDSQAGAPVRAISNFIPKRKCQRKLPGNLTTDLTDLTDFN
jgi:hypothetical protein